MIHIGIIPDGNRRWYKSKNLDINKFQEFIIKKITNNIINYSKKILKDKKIKDMKKIIDEFDELNNLKKISEFSIYICSIDNITRNDGTKDLIFDLIRNLYIKYPDRSKIFSKDVLQIFDNFSKDFKFNIIGDIELLPQDIQDILNELILKTKDGNFIINIALAYDYNKDLINYGKNKLKNYNREQSNIDLLFRSGKEKRISGFFPTKILYSELFFSDKLWPDIGLEDIDFIIGEFFKRNRRFGK